MEASKAWISISIIQVNDIPIKWTRQDASKHVAHVSKNYDKNKT